MKLNKFKVGWMTLAMIASVGIGSALGQHDDTRALLDTLVKKGLLSNQEAADVAAKINKDVKMDSGYKIKVASWLDELKIYGDMRVRYDQISNRRVASTLSGSNDEQDRTRFRLRLRFGLDAKAGDWTAGFRLGSGDSSAQPVDPISENATLTNFGAMKNINLDKAYLMYQPKVVDGLSLVGGKFENPFWETDMVYDPDLAPEGFAEKYKHDFNDNLSVFVNLSQWVLAENNVGSGAAASATAAGAAADASIRGKDVYLFGFQVGDEWKVIPKKLEWKQAVAFYDYEGLQNVSIPGFLSGADNWRNTTAVNFGNVVPEDRFRVLTLNEEIRLGIWENYPIRLQGEYINNVGTSFFTNQPADMNEGFKIGGILGDAKHKGDWQIGYWYEYLGANANWSVFSDSDFGNGGTNNRGHIIKAVYNVTDFVSLSLSYWNVTAISDVVSSGVAPGGSQVNQVGGTGGNCSRIMLDALMKF